MALYHNAADLTFSTSTVFSTSYEPGQSAPFGGVYKCTGCGHEISTARYHSLPPQNNHQHANPFVPIRWQPVVLHN